ncbi:hypothetical protein N7475_003427 [Penicillium sp. IBT 31633x]|nr:hypothetical protein N7475_003427 [Penicillium sp. IBT 31633x]
MLPMDLASARGTKVRDIVIDHRPSTGRGKKLTLAQERVLRTLYEQELPSLAQGEQPVKSFWVNLASRFREHTGREYSWLSVKRRAAAWRQRSSGGEEQLDTPHAGEVSGENPLDRTGHGFVARNYPGLQVPCDAPQLAPSRSTPSPNPEDPSHSDHSEHEKSPGVSSWLQHNWFSGVTGQVQGTGKDSRSSRMSKSRLRSRSPQHVSRPKYRRRSPSPKRRTQVMPKQMYQQSASASRESPVFDPNASDLSAHEGMELNPSSNQKIPEIRGSRESAEKNNAYYLADNSEMPKRGYKTASQSPPESPQLSETDDLPVAPALIVRRRAVPNENGNAAKCQEP